MSLLQAAILGVVQGLTEFLPVSSSGHLVLGQALLGIDPAGVTFEVVLHLATVCAILWVYRGRVGALVRGVAAGDGDARRYVGLLLLASVPAGLAGVFGRPIFERAFSNPVLAAAMLLVSGVLVWSVKISGARANRDRLDGARSFWIGCAQAVAILPGISRSGATVATGAWLGIEVVRLAEFSFLLSVPAILGAGLLQLGEVGGAADLGFGPLAVGFGAAAISGVLAIRVFVAMLRDRTFHRFAYYCWSAGAAYLIAAVFVPTLR